MKRKREGRGGREEERERKGAHRVVEETVSSISTRDTSWYLYLYIYINEMHINYMLICKMTYNNKLMNKNKKIMKG